MKQIQFTIYDNAANAYLPPFCLHNEQMAMRVFGDCIQSADHQFSKHPSDYTLFKIGEFDDISGQLTPEKAPQSLCNGIQFVLDQKPVTVENEKPVGNGSPIQPSSTG